MRRFVVAVPAGDAAADVLALGRIEHTMDDPILDVVTVIPAPWSFRSKASVDAEFVAFHEERAAAILAHAREVLADIPSAEFHVLHEHGSVARTLLEHAVATDAEALVVGSPHGTPGRFSLSSTANVLLHRSPIPVGMAPEGYDPPPGTRLSRVTVGISGGPSQHSALALATRLAHAGGVPLRLATLQVMDAGMAVPVVGFDTEGIVDTEWKADLEVVHRQLIESLPADLHATSTIVRGSTWPKAIDALDPLDGEVLVIGSSEQNVLRHVFLGTHSNKIVCSSSIPVIVTPAGGG